MSYTILTGTYARYRTFLDGAIRGQIPLSNLHLNQTKPYLISLQKDNSLSVKLQTYLGAVATLTR